MLLLLLLVRSQRAAQSDLCPRQKRGRPSVDSSARYQDGLLPATALDEVIQHDHDEEFDEDSPRVQLTRLLEENARHRHVCLGAAAQGQTPPETLEKNGEVVSN